MKKSVLISVFLLAISLLVMAQTKMFLYFNDGTTYETIATNVDSIVFISENTSDENEPNANGHEYVDLGLPSGLLWATCNVGAETPEDNGSYFAWGEIKPKISYSKENYKWYSGNEWIKYNNVDNKTILEISDDAANANWGGDWRMPTKEELEELVSECTWEWTTKNEVYGYQITSKTNGNSIFLPAAGFRSNYHNLDNLDNCGNYWSSTRYESYYRYAWNLGISQRAYEVLLEGPCASNVGNLENGLPVRPVLRVGLTYNIVFDSNGGEGTMPSIAIEHAGQLSIPENTFTRSNAQFICWNTKADGTGTVYKKGDIFTVTKDITLYAQWYVKETDKNHEYVDLGLPSGTLWATCNVGASKPEESGYFFAWGETQPEIPYSYENYKWYSGNEWIKYNNVDNKTILELSDDAANVNWGGSWRMPTKAEQDELRTECIWTWTTQNGVNGYKVTSKTNGNSIFLPAAGFHYNSDLGGVGSDGGYWSSSLYSNDSQAYHLYFSSYDVGWYHEFQRNSGLSVRPVLRVGFTYNIVFDSNGGEGTMPSIAIDHAEQLTIPENKFTREGYTFTSWNTKADGTGVNYKEGDVFCVASDITFYAQWEKIPTINANGHEYVDLGLPSGLLWATCNIGADSPEKYGDYFTWGETEPKTIYNWSTHKWCNGSSSSITKYTSNRSDFTLELSDDAASVNWGGTWRIPTPNELNELRTKCTWTWETKNGVDGYIVTGPNGNSIFLPAAGYRSNSSLNYAGIFGFYSSNSVHENSGKTTYIIAFDSNEIISNLEDRSSGYTIRPVLEYK